MGQERKPKGWYPLEFKRRAIALAREIGSSQAGPKLGIAADTLNVWIWLEDNGRKVTKQDTPEQRAAKLAERELQKLRRENEELKKANFILKEVAKVFSKDRSNSDLRRSLNSMVGKKSPK